MVKNENLYDAVIVGGGPAGLTAALYLARARYRVVVVEKDAFGGQITLTSEVVNYPGVKSASGVELTGAMHDQAASFGAEFLQAEVTSLEVKGDIKIVQTSAGELGALSVLLATGAHPRTLGFEGEEAFTGRGVAYCATCDGEFFTGKEVFVVGGGYAAAEESMYLTRYAKHVTVLIRGEGFTCAPAIVEQVMANDNITVLPFTEVESVGGDTALRTLRYRNVQTGEVTEFSSGDNSFGIFVFAGYAPASSLVQGIAEVNEAGYVITNEYQQTSASGLFAAGDVCEKRLRQVVTATGEAALAATEMQDFLKIAREKTGIAPQVIVPQSQGSPAVAAADAYTVEPGAHPDGAAAAPTEIDACPVEGDTYPTELEACPVEVEACPVDATDFRVESTRFTGEKLEQLNTVFARMERPLLLKLTLDERPVSKELHAFMQELSMLTSMVFLGVKTLRGPAAEQYRDTPKVQVCFEDGTPTGLAFHGVPGGHEFNSFLVGLYNAAGPAQVIDEAARLSIAAIERDAKIQVLVTLTCTLCPDTVIAAQRIAAESEHVSAEVYDIAHFPALREQYNVMSVPCIVVDEGRAVSFGKKNIHQVLKLIGAESDQ